MKVIECLNEFSDLIETIEIIEYKKEEHVSITKIKLRLLDATILWIREVKYHEDVVAYSYYWLRSDNSVIIGWDNAPHHKEVNTFPHHKHVGKKVEHSEQTDIRQVMKFIRNFLEGSSQS